MAEAAAGLYVAGEAVETAVQAGVGAYYVAKPTMPLRATFTQISPASDESTKSALALSGHTISLVRDKAFIFGGETASGKIAGNEVYSVTLSSSEKPSASYESITAASFAEEGKLPAPRKRHSACTLNERIAMYGGLDENSQTISEGTKFWLFDTGKEKWEELEAADKDVFPKPRSDAHLLMCGDANNVVLYGGIDAAGNELKDVWHCNCLTRMWTQLPEAPVSSPNAALVDGVLYIVSETHNVGGDIHYLQIATRKPDDEISWDSTPFPANPLTPGPSARKAAGLVPVTTGYGRQYLVYLFGALTSNGSQAPLAESAETPEASEAPKASAPEYCSDVWTYQLPSTDPEIKATTNFTEALKPAKIKDKIREALGIDDGKHSWCEVEVLPPAELPESEGKVHPGPRASFASAVTPDRHSVVIWGGMNPKGEMESDGWVIKLE